MGPAEGQADGTIGPVTRQPLEPGIAIDLQHTAECRQMLLRSPGSSSLVQ
jgi:hypothetical protein